MNLSARWLVAAFLLVCGLGALPAAGQTVVTLYSQYNAPQYVAVDANKTVFVTDTTNSLSALGLQNGVYATTPTAYDTNFATLYVSPNGVAVGPDGHILSVSMDSSVPGFFFLFEFGPPNYAEIQDGSLPVNGGAVQGVAADSLGNFYVADTNGTVIKIFAPDYQAATAFSIGQGGTNHPYGIAFDSYDNLFVADQQSGSGQILEYTGTTLVNTITSGNLQQPTGVAVDSIGNLYVADSAANTLTAFAAPDYTNAQVIVSTGLSGPMGVAVDADDNIFVVDTGHNALKEVLALPAVTAVAASAGPLGGGNLVTITGKHLSGASAVSFGGTAATSFTVVSDTEVTATAPAGGAGTVDVRVTTPNGTSIVAPSDRYAYTAAPAVQGLSSSSGPTAGGNIVTIEGSRFVGASAVSFGGTPAASFSVVGATLISAVAPAGTAGIVDVTVTTPGGTSPTSSNDNYTYVSPPVVGGVSPGAGPTAGGTAVTISGSGLGGATAVSFGATAASSFTVDSATQITATAPARAAGAVDVTVTSIGGTSATSSADAYTYVAAPAVSAIGPSFGPASGGTTVTITGTNLLGTTAVAFGGSAALGFTVNSATQITAIAPSGSAGTVDVRVTTVGGTSATTAADQFTYLSVPVVSGISPSHGPTAGGTTVTITGNNLTGATSVKFGGTAATSFSIVSATQISATAPAGSAGAADVTVTTPAGTSATSAADTFTYVAAPVVSGLSPAAGPTSGGTAVVITGSNLFAARAVTFGTTAATSFTVNSATQITAIAPSGAAGTLDVTVTTVGGTSATTVADQFTYLSVPAVSGISPSHGPTAGGTTVTITGNNLTGATSVKFGGTAATSFNIVSATQISATAPAGSAGAVDVTVTTPGGTSATSAADTFTYVAAPVVSGLSPAAGPTSGGTAVVITGSNLFAARAVTFGTTAATSFTVNSATQITAIAPSGSAGTVDVTVTTVGGTSATTVADQFTYLSVPAVSGISPSHGPTAGGTTVTITGTSLTGATAVKFGGTAATSFSIVSATQISATAPAGSAGAVDVTVTTPGGTSATSAADAFTYVAAPVVSGLSPAAGPTSGGTAVVITGSNLFAARAVTFGTTAATSFTVNSATQITAIAPSGAAGTLDVTVTTVGGTSATTVADQFTYLSVPAVSGISPTDGPTAGGTTVTITGTNLTGATAVKFGGTAATSFSIVSATQISATTPAGSAGTVDVTVTTPGGTSATSAADAFIYVAAPVVSGLSPAEGATRGGPAVVITGSNLSAASAVTFGGTAALRFTVNSATQITVNPPPGVAGTVDVTVTTPGGTSPTGAADQYSYVSAPTIGALSPAAGPLAGGTVVTVTGTGFTGATAVTFGGIAATGFAVVSDTQITATTPPRTAGLVNVRVTTVGGTGVTGAGDEYAYVALPAVASIGPHGGPLAGGGTVTILGSNLAGATAVAFGGTPAAGFTVVAANKITATVPAGTAGPVDVTVTTPGGTSATGAGDLYTYAAAPTVTSVGPAGGPVAGHTAVTITGTNLTGATSVHFGASAATGIAVVSATEITATAPAHAAGTVDVTVTTPGGISAAAAGDQYAYVAAPTVSAVGPASGAGGTVVTITGSNLAGATAIRFGGTAAASFTVVGATKVTATAPPHGAGLVDVTVTTPGGTSAATSHDGFTYVAAPSVAAVSPAIGPSSGGRLVTITGTHLGGALSVKFGATPAVGFTVVNAGKITAVAPAHGAGTVDVTVRTAGGTSAAGAADQFTYLAAPAVAAVSPVRGPMTGGNTVTILGANLAGASAVKFGGTPATGFTVVTAGKITATAPAGTAGTVDVTVTTPAGTSETSARDAYLYLVAPIVAGVGPNGGSTRGGTAVTILGENFTDVTAVRFGGTAAAGFTVVSVNQIEAIAPAHAPGTVGVTVTTPGGISAIGPDDSFTYSAAPAAPPTETVLYRFTGRGDGAHPQAPLALDDAGALYGTSPGAAGTGTLFRLAAPASGAAAWRFELLRSVAAVPSGLLLDDSGTTLYGMSLSQAGIGTAFALGPQGMVNPIYRFPAGAGAAPSPLTVDMAGALYGTAGLAGDSDVVLRLAPPRSPGEAWSESRLYRFKGGADGAASGDALLVDQAGIVYGVTRRGGAAGLGQVYALMPPARAGLPWTRTILHSFGGEPDGADPAGPLLAGRDGALYGLTRAGGSPACAGGCGTVYRLAPAQGSRTGWSETVIHRFQAGSDGAEPSGPLALDPSGALYGATARGGAGHGVVFKLAPGPVGAAWPETVLHRFLAGSDGAEPAGGVVIDAGGALYGVTRSGGLPANNAGTIYRIVP